MLKQDTLYTGEEARARLISGIRKVAQAVGGTMGTSGQNSLIEAMETPYHLVTNDGYTIASKIRLADPIEEMGRNILMEAISRANKNSGDGSSTTCVLTSAIIEEGTKFLGEKSPMEIKRSLEDCIPLIEEALNKQKREITVDEVGAVAAISAEDPQIGALIQEIYQKIGKDGIIYWDISKTAEDSYTIGTGLTVDFAGLASPYMADRDNSTGQLLNVAKLKNPQVIITKEKLTTAASFEKLFIQLNGLGKKEVLIFCDDFDVQVIAQFVATQQVQGFRTVVVKLPTIWNDQWTEDLALASGATVINPAGGLLLKDLKLEHLGTFGHVSIDKESTYIDGIKDLSEHIANLQAEGSDSSLIRAARLNTKTARYFVGAHSDSALSYRRLKVEDAISAAYQALNGGIVIGGGMPLGSIGWTLGDSVGAKILCKALLAPMEQIQKNMGKTYKNGFEYQKELEDNNVYDPMNVVFNAVKNAISVAAAVLTTNTIVLLPRAEQDISSGVPVQL